MILELFQMTSTDFKGFENLGIVGILVAVIYLLHRFFNGQTDMLRKDIESLKAENKTLRDEFTEIQIKMIEVIQNNTNAFNNFIESSHKVLNRRVRNEKNN